MYVLLILILNAVFDRQTSSGYWWFRGSILKEVISDLKRENQFLSKEIWESI
jgi:hypothetical protein